MQTHVPNQSSGKSSIIAALIVAAGLIMSAIIVAQPKIPLQVSSLFPPIAIQSVKQQVASQLQSQLSGRQVTIWSGEKVKLRRLEIESANYNSERNQYSVRYNLYWNNNSRSMSGIGCFLASNNAKSFSGGCNIGEEHITKGVTRSITVPVIVR